MSYGPDSGEFTHIFSGSCLYIYIIYIYISDCKCVIETSVTAITKNIIYNIRLKRAQSKTKLFQKEKTRKSEKSIK